MKRWIIAFLFLFCAHCGLVCSLEKEHYLINLEKALDAHHFHDDREDVMNLFLQIFENEIAHPDFIQCVTAQDCRFYAYQVIAKELYRKIYGEPRKEFEFLRFHTLSKNREEFSSLYPSLMISKTELAKEFKTNEEGLEDALKTFEKQDEEEFLRISKGEEESHDDDGEDEGVSISLQINDTMPEVSKELLSVNFTMETYRPLDSALFVFLSGHSISLFYSPDDDLDYQYKISKIFCELFDSLSLPKEKVIHCVTKLIEKAPRSQFGIINQIFIPKENVNNCLYLAFGGGLLHPVYDSTFENSLLEFQNSREDSSFRTFRNFQARIIAGALFEDPKIKIFRYTLIPEEDQRKYERIVRDALNELLQAL